MGKDSSGTYKVQTFKKNDYMVWHVCTQCLNLGKIVFKDDSKTYFSVEKSSYSTDLQHIGQGGAFYEGGSNLRIELTVYNSGVDQKASINSFGITDNVGGIVGNGYNFCIEDGTDNDYNDFYINVVAWNKKG